MLYSGDPAVGCSDGVNCPGRKILYPMAVQNGTAVARLACVTPLVRFEASSRSCNEALVLGVGAIALRSSTVTTITLSESKPVRTDLRFLTLRLIRSAHAPSTKVNMT